MVYLSTETERKIETTERAERKKEVWKILKEGRKEGKNYD